MRSAEDIEGFLIRLGAEYDALGNNVWLVKETTPPTVLSIAGEVIVFRVKVLDLPRVKADQLVALYRELLTLNATEMLHGAYGLEETAIVITDALQLENLDFNEFQATMDDLGLAVNKHYPLLSRYVG